MSPRRAVRVAGRLIGTVVVAALVVGVAMAVAVAVCWAVGAGAVVFPLGTVDVSASAPDGAATLMLWPVGIGVTTAFVAAALLWLDARITRPR